MYTLGIAETVIAALCMFVLLVVAVSLANLVGKLQHQKASLEKQLAECLELNARDQVVDIPSFDVVEGIEDYRSVHAIEGLPTYHQNTPISLLLEELNEHDLVFLGAKTKAFYCIAQGKPLGSAVRIGWCNRRKLHVLEMPIEDFKNLSSIRAAFNKVIRLGVSYDFTHNRRDYMQQIIDAMRARA
ncbi:hypothetical protein KAZ57_03260 [Patescibacteria group bacterium]|nr:hypothetical protein [Patescibacteria group bacterium]